MIADFYFIPNNASHSDILIPQCKDLLNFPTFQVDTLYPYFINISYNITATKLKTTTIITISDIPDKSIEPSEVSQ